MNDSPPTWQSRIVGHGEVAATELRANPRNARRHPKAQKKAMAGMLDEVGWVQDVIVNKRSGLIVDGHLRVELAAQRGESVPVKYVDLSAEDEALVLASLDPLAALAKTDQQALDALLGSAEANNAAFQSFLDGMASTPTRRSGHTLPDAAPEIPEVVVSRPGDIWLLGPHRLMCGDATDTAQLDRLLVGQLADVLLTDPPYNVNYSSPSLGGILNDNLDERTFVRLMLGMAIQAKRVLRPGGSYYVFMSAIDYSLVCYQLRRLGLLGRPLIWAKPSAGLGQADFRPQYEVILYGNTEPRKDRTWNGGRRQTDFWDNDADRGVVVSRENGERVSISVGFGLETVTIELDAEEPGPTGTVTTFDGSAGDLWRFGRERGTYVHPTQKPVAVLERALTLSSREEDVVLDMFAGSGSTLIACEMLGRQFAGMELDPRYVDVAVRRWEAFTNTPALRQTDTLVKA